MDFSKNTNHRLQKIFDRLTLADNQNRFVAHADVWYLPYLFFIYIILALVYYFWRLGISRTWGVWFVAPLLFFEGYNIFFTAIYFFTAKKLLRPAWRPPLKGKTVDIFIPTYNEPVEIVAMTAIAASQVRGVRHVFVLDDGKRLEIKKTCQEIGVKYLARGDNRHAKAGNMNFGLAHSDAEFFLFLDCDHVPHESFIERTLGYFNDEKLALVQTPQVFYNLDSFQHRRNPFFYHWNEQSMFYESIQPGKNRFNAAFFCGSGAIFRRTAVGSVGGFATETATEDIHTSLRLHAKGWHSLFVHEYLAFGLAPEDLREYHKQRVRWGAGSLGLLFRSKDSPLWARGLTFLQRVSYIDSSLAHAYGIQKLFYYLLPVTILMTIPAYTGVLTDAFWTFLLASIIFGLFSYSTVLVFSRRTYHPIYTEQYNSANIFAHIEALKGIVRLEKKFGVSLKLKPFSQTTYSYGLLHLLALLMLASPVVAAFEWIHSGRSLPLMLYNSAFMSAFFWNSINIALLFPFVRYARNLTGKNLPPYRISVFAPVEINGSPQNGLLTYARFNGCLIQSDQPLPGPAIAFDIQLASGNQEKFQGKLINTTRLENQQFLSEIYFDDFTVTKRKLWVNCLFNQLIPSHFATS